MDGSKVWEAWQNGEIAGIRDYCETDVMNTYLLYLRFRLLRGVIAAADAAGRLPFYGGLAGSAGFVHIVQGLIELFKGAAIAPDRLAAALSVQLSAIEGMSSTSVLAKAEAE